MKEEALVSIVIPVFNGSKFIGTTLECLLQQSYSVLEVIVIDDGSTDTTPDIVKEYCKIDSRVRYIRQENSGVSIARNKGLLVAKGEYVVFFDADDECDEHFIRLRIQALLSDTSAGYSCGELRAFRGDRYQIEFRQRGIVDQVAETILLYKPGYSTVPSNYMFRRVLLLQNNIAFDERLWTTADRLFLLEVSKVMQGIYVENSPLFYRLHSGSMSARLTERFIRDNELFWDIAVSKQLIPESIFWIAKRVHYRMIGRSYGKIRNLQMLKWIWKGMYECGIDFLLFFFKRISKSISD